MRSALFALAASLGIAIGTASLSPASAEVSATPTATAPAAVPVEMSDVTIPVFALPLAAAALLIAVFGGAAINPKQTRNELRHGDD